MKIYGDIQSGNCYKIKLLTSILEIDHEWIEVDILANETQTDGALCVLSLRLTKILWSL